MSEYIWIFSDFFFCKKTLKSHEIWICFRKKIKHYKKFLSNRKLEENLKKNHIYWHKLSNQFVEESFFHWFVENFLELLICKINILSTFRIVDVLKISDPSGNIQNTIRISLLAGNVYPGWRTSVNGLYCPRLKRLFTLLLLLL